jgi:hypothetical protein
MFDRLRRIYSKPKLGLSDEARAFIGDMAASDVWLLAIGVRGTPAMPSMTEPESFPAALKILAAHRMELSELGDDDSVFPFNYRREGRQILPFFSSEEIAGHFLANSGFKSDLSAFRPYCLLAGFIAAPQNEKFDLVLDLHSSSERKIDDAERLLLRSLTTAV